MSPWRKSAAWHRKPAPSPVASNMLTLTMRREHEDSKGEGYVRQRSRDGGATGGDEFVDILQVQQLLIDSGGNGNGSRNRGRGRDPVQANEGRGRLLDTFGTPPYYYGGYGQHHPPTSTNVDDLVALWFAGPTATGAFNTYLPLDNY